MGFQDATKKQSKARIALMGPAGSGKTYGALLIARMLGSKSVGVIDSERGSASKYSHQFKFKVSEPNEFSLRTYLAEVEEAKKAAFDTLIIDSFSHTWSGKGGALEQVDSMGGNKFANGWKTVSPLQNKLIDSLLTFPGHVIATMRSKTEYAIEQVDGKSIPKRVGLKPVQRDDVEYEFDLLLQLGSKGEISVAKQRGCDKLEGFEGTRKDLPFIITEFKSFLTDGATPPEEQPKPAAVAPQEKK